jgi:DNA-binding NarL/FixJ family response regulator
MKIAIIEDHLMTRDFVRKVCLMEPDVDVVAESASGSEAVEEVTCAKPELIVLDIELPDFDGIEVLSRIRQRGAQPKVIVLSSHGSPYLIYRIAKARVQGFVDKREQTCEVLREAIRAVLSGRTYFSDSFLRIRTRSTQDPFAFEKMLTDQQILVLAMVADLVDDESIGSNLAIAARTVEAHRTAIMHKLGVHSRTDLIRVAQAHGFTSGHSPQR